MKKEHKTIKQRISEITYQQTAIALAVISLGLIVTSICISVSNRGMAGYGIGLFGIVAFILSAIGVVVTIYGHNYVEMKEKLHWLWCLIPNAVFAGSMLILYILGFFL